jgi:hypothetical protein
MNDVLEPPAERDMPAHRSARMRARLLGSLHRPTARRGRRRLVMAMAGLVAIAGLAVPVLPERDDAAVEALAMSSAELSPRLRDVTRQCLEWNARQQVDGSSGVPVVRSADLAMAARRDHRAVTVFLTPTGYFACDLWTAADGGEDSGSAGGEQWQVRDWMPGPVQRLSLTSSEIDSGDVIVAGRVSNRVQRLVLEHGNGRRTTARIERGVFGLISQGPVTKKAELIAYAKSGEEVGRRPLFPPVSEREQCYVDPSGKVVYGDSDPPCRLAEPWTR